MISGVKTLDLHGINEGGGRAGRFDKTQNDYYFNQEMKNEVLENMSCRPKYTNYLDMKEVINKSTYVASKRIMAIYSLKKETETTIQELRKLLKTLPEDDQPYME
ncbi:unnamed protein product [Lactuca saligna]|uniref:Uncharacterized protein n=1 Tax=Lactuca saligna TaxID=75948 RepID=A0AA35VNS2_LACSI|nr:unnamed protein product [Lactuca saligna]